jgi:phage shock protein PspC (stress-responsive transcriptional regulator)
MNTTSPENREIPESSVSPDHPVWGSPSATEPPARPAAEDAPRGRPERPVPPIGGSDRPWTPRGAAFFDGIRRLGVVRPDEGRWAAGVCAGLARRWGTSPGLVRLLFVVAALISGLGLVGYGLLWLFLPHPDGRIHAQQVLHGVVTGGFVGGVIAILLNRPFDGPWNAGVHMMHHGPRLLPVVLIGLLVWWLVRRARGHGHVRHQH